MTESPRLSRDKVAYHLSQLRTTIEHGGNRTLLEHDLEALSVAWAEFDAAVTTLLSSARASNTVQLELVTRNSLWEGRQGSIERRNAERAVETQEILHRWAR